MSDSGTNSSLGGTYDYFDRVLNFYFNHYEYYGYIFWRDHAFDWVKALATGNYTIDEREFYSGEPVDPEGFSRLNNFVFDLFVAKPFFTAVENVITQTSPLPQAINCFGIVTNVINMVVFRRQGILKDSCTVTLTAMSICDLVSFSMTFALGVGWYIAKALDDNYNNDNDDDNDHPLDYETNPAEFTRRNINIFIFQGVLSFSIRTIQQLFLLQILGWITTYLAVERMISVTFPFRVKSLITPKRSCVIISSFCLATFLIQAPRLINNKILWMEVGGSNGTFKPGLGNPEILPHWFVNALTHLNKTIFPLVNAVAIAGCNIVVAVKVSTSQKFRTSGMSTKGEKTSKKNVGKTPGLSFIKLKSSDLSNKDNSKLVDSKTRKELRLIRLMFVMSFTFLIARTPDIAFIIIQQIMMTISPYWFRRFVQTTVDFFVSLESIGSFLVTTNGATNIFVYYTLSSKYRAIFLELFSCSHCKKRK